MERNRLKRKVLVPIKIGVSIGLMIYLLSRINLGEMKVILGNSYILGIVMAYILYIGSQVVSSWRWWVILKRWRTLKDLTGIYFIGCFFNNFMPTGIGGDSVKVYYVHKRGKGLGEALVSVFMDRYIGMGAMIIIGSMGYIFGWRRIQGGMGLMVWPAIVCGYVVGSWIMWKFRWERIWAPMKGFYEEVMGYKGRGSDIREAFLGGLVVQGMGIGSVWMIGKSIGVEVGFMEYVMIVPIASVLTMVPVSISGIGIREGTMVYMMGFFGTNEAQALGVGLVWLGVILLGNMIGGIVFMKDSLGEKKRKKDMNIRKREG